MEVMPVSARLPRVGGGVAFLELCSSRLSSAQLWTPPTPPQDDNDIYVDPVLCLTYESTPIPESKLPPVYVRKERRRHRTDPSGAHPAARRACPVALCSWAGRQLYVYSPLGVKARE